MLGKASGTEGGVGRDEKKKKEEEERRALQEARVALFNTCLMRVSYVFNTC